MIAREPIFNEKLDWFPVVILKLVYKGLEEFVEFF